MRGKVLASRTALVLATAAFSTLALTTTGCSAGTPLAAPPGAGKVIIDADMGMLNDDAHALFLLAAAEQVDLLGVTTVGGNTWPEEGTAYALRQLELIGRTGVPVVTGETNVPSRREGYVGALARPRPTSPRTLPTPPTGGYAAAEPAPGTASDFLADQVRRHPGEVTVFALGPATNLARAVRAHPEMIPLVKEVVYVGAGTESSEFNRWFDPEASKTVFATPFKRQLVIPLETAERPSMDRDTYERVVAGPPTPVKTLITSLLGPLYARDEDHREPVWDAVAAAAFLHPDLVTDSNGSVALDVDQARFWDLYVELLSSPALTRPAGLTPSPALARPAELAPLPVLAWAAGLASSPAAA